MKTSNLVSLLMALVLSTAGFSAIDYLFTQGASGHARHAAELMLRP